MIQFIKIDQIYEIIKTEETWFLKVYDYPEEWLREYSDGKYHKVYAESEDRGYELYESYSKYTNKKVGMEYIEIKLKNIITDEIVTKTFKTLDEKNIFIKENIVKCYEDFNIILKYKEMKQKERHQNELIETKLKIARGLQKSINIGNGLPLDLC